MANMMDGLPRRWVLQAALSSGACALGGCVSMSLKNGASAFVARSGSAFTRKGRPYRFAGANAWYLAYLGADAPFGNRARLRKELDRLKMLGVTNVRLLAGAEEGPLKNSIKPGFVDRLGQVNKVLLTGLDYAMAELGRRDMTAVLYFTNNWEWSGGMVTRLWYQNGRYIDMNDPAHPWPAFPDLGSQFYSNDAALLGYYDYVRQLVTRRNSVTGIYYVDDPTLMSWQLCNEPRPGVSPSVMEHVLPSYYKWIDDSVALIRSLDPNHLVSLGMEGTIATNGSTAIVDRAHLNVDYYTAHIWPLNWGWVDGKNLAGTWDSGRQRVQQYVDSHVALASAAAKPLVFEEFGFPRDDEAYDPSTTTRFRQRYYQLIFDAAENSLRSGGPVAGTNFWAWNGEARTAHPDWRFKDGDLQYMGDPPHEPQGWYGNFDSDTPILNQIRNHARKFAAA